LQSTQTSRCPRCVIHPQPPHADPALVCQSTLRATCSHSVRVSLIPSFFSVAVSCDLSWGGPPRSCLRRVPSPCPPPCALLQLGGSSTPACISVSLANRACRPAVRGMSIKGVLQEGSVERPIQELCHARVDSSGVHIFAEHMRMWVGVGVGVRVANRGVCSYWYMARDWACKRSAPTASPPPPPPPDPTRPHSTFPPYPRCCCLL
jgi:hypothetical protein